MTNAKTKPAQPSAYALGRMEWSDRMGDVIKQAAIWRAVAVGSLTVAGIAVSGLVYQASQVKLVPYVVEVDKLHATLPIGPADRAAKADSRIVRAQLADFISDLRSVYLDAAAEQTAVRSAYAKIDQSSAAFQVVNEHMAANDPFKRAQRESVTVEVQSVLPLSPDTWRVEWVEVTRARDGTVTSSRPWSAAVTTKLQPPTTEAGLLNNPLGIYVTAISWSPRVQS